MPMPWVLVKFEPPFQMMLVIASVSLLVLQVTEKLLVVTILSVGSMTTNLEPGMTGLRRTALTAAVDAVAGFCAMAGAANVKMDTAMAERTTALSVRDFFPRAKSSPRIRSFVIGNLHSAGFGHCAALISAALLFYPREARLFGGCHRVLYPHGGNRSSGRRENLRLYRRPSFHGCQ